MCDFYPSLVKDLRLKDSINLSFKEAFYVLDTNVHGYRNNNLFGACLGYNLVKCVWCDIDLELTWLTHVMCT